MKYLIAALEVLAGEIEIAEDEMEVERKDSELKVSIDGVGTASGAFLYFDDDETAMEVLGLEAYGDDEAVEIAEKIQDVSHIFYLESIEIDPSVRKKGYGQVLLNGIEEIAKEEGVDAIMGNASPFGWGSSRVPFSLLKKFYKKMGYEFLYEYKGQNGLIIKRV